MEEKLGELKAKQAAKEEEQKKRETENADDAFVNPSSREATRPVRKRSRSRSQSPQAVVERKQKEEESNSKADRLKALKERFKQRKLQKVESEPDESD